MEKDFPVMKKKFLRIFAFSEVVLIGVSSVHVTEASLGAIYVMVDQ